MIGQAGVDLATCQVSNEDIRKSNDGFITFGLDFGMPRKVAVFEFDS